MKIQQNFSLKKYNTFGMDVYAKYFATFNSHDDLQSVLQSSNIPNERSFILGGGSNILFTKSFDGIILKNEIKGIRIITEDEKYVYIKAGAGEQWHQFVLHCIQRHFSGVENLSLIPGNIGAAPIQNIGAYGAEVKDVFHSLEAYHLKEKKIITFTLNDCEFGYRDSVFKKKYKGEFVILDVTFKLNKKQQYNISYGAIADELKRMHVYDVSIKSISDAVINIRSSKLPDPAMIGNAGSFFKNPIVTSNQFEQLKNSFPTIPFFKNDEEHVKVPAGWLIEQCGWKGYRKGDAGCYEKQALVLVNYGQATGDEILRLSNEIAASVYEKFNISLEKEVNVV